MGLNHSTYQKEIQTGASSTESLEAEGVVCRDDGIDAEHSAHRLGCGGGGGGLGGLLGRLGGFLCINME